MKKFEWPNRPLVVWSKKPDIKPHNHTSLSNLKLCEPPVEEDELDPSEWEDCEIAEFSPILATIYKLDSTGNWTEDETIEIYCRAELEGLEDEFCTDPVAVGFNATDKEGLYSITYESL